MKGVRPKEHLLKTTDEAVVKVNLVHCGGILNKPKLAFFNLMMFLKDVVSSRNVFGNIAPLEKLHRDEQLEQ
jgi:hypothetical protein